MSLGSIVYEKIVSAETARCNLLRAQAELDEDGGSNRKAEGRTQSSSFEFASLNFRKRIATELVVFGAERVASSIHVKAKNEESDESLDNESSSDGLSRTDTSGVDVWKRSRPVRSRNWFFYKIVRINVRSFKCSRS